MHRTARSLATFADCASPANSRNDSSLEYIPGNTLGSFHGCPGFF
jgi:hypothetical protein